MAVPKRRLGRGLASLINEEANVAAVTGAEGLRTVAIEALNPSPLNPRVDFTASELDELADSIRMRGLVQPIVVRPMNGQGGGFEIIAGERRWRAAQKAALHEVPVIVRSMSDKEALELAIIENVQRADLNAMEEAGGYRKLMDSFGYTQEELAGIVGKSRSHLANTLRLLNLPPAVQQLIRQGALSAGHARALVGRDDAEQIARDIVKRELSVRDVEAMIQRRESGKVSPGRSAKTKSTDIRAAERELSDALGLSVEIAGGKVEKGQLRISYATLEQFEDVRKRLLKK
jgi:ParB family chromosome partitioning protein